MSICAPLVVVTGASMRRFMLPSKVVSSCRMTSFLDDGKSSAKSRDVADSASGVEYRGRSARVSKRFFLESSPLLASDQVFEDVELCVDSFEAIAWLLGYDSRRLSLQASIGSVS